MRRPIKDDTVKERTYEICDMCKNADICKYMDQMKALEDDLNNAIDHLRNKSGHDSEVTDLLELYPSCKHKILSF